MTQDFGWLTLLPVLVVILLAIRTRSSFEPLVVGILTGCIIAYQWNFLDKFIEHLTTALTSRDRDRKSTRLNSSHVSESRMPSSA